MTHYEALGVAEDATQDEIKRAYRKAAVKHHPDKNPGDPKAADRFKRVAEAYEVLGDEAKRAEYDRPPVLIDLIDVFAELWRED